jgi:hypothetical protein
MRVSNSKNIVLSPDSEWSRILTEETERQSLVRYGITMTIIAYFFLFLLTFAFSALVSTLVPFAATHVMVSVVIQFALAVASIYIVPQILASVAPTFGGENNGLNALKLYVFASTPAWLGTSVSVIPVIGWLAAIAGVVYAIYLFWKHFAEAMSIPEDKKIQYLAVAVVLLIVVNLVIGAIGTAIANVVAPVSVFRI